jgi:single-strand DNA-binding protein
VREPHLAARVEEGAMNDLTVTVTGWVATDPRIHVVPGGTDLVSFRMASTSRYFDRAQNAWIDRDTEWFTVRVFRAPALLVQRSVKKGQPVVVVGRLHSNEWKAESGTRTDLVIDAQTVGHDLTRGIADFARAVVEGNHVTVSESSGPEEPEQQGEQISEAEVGDELADVELDGEVLDADETLASVGR